jgi:Entner-Doudoroff aldolase
VKLAPAEFLQVLWRERATAILRTDDQQVAANAMQAAVRGGFRSIEFTMTVPGVLELIAEFSERDDLVVGAGTVLTVGQAKAAVDAGATFLVSPVTDEDVIHAASELGVAIIPGTYSPTEMWRAHRAGAQLQKLFPVTAGGPAHVRSILGPMPFCRIVPTNGVDGDNAAAYLEAGAFALGFVGTLFDRARLAAGDFSAIEERAKQLLSAVATVTRPDQPPPAIGPSHA